MLDRKVLGLLSVVSFAFCLVVSVMAQISVTPTPGGVYVPPGGTDTGFGGGNAISGMILLSTGQRLERRVTVRLQTMTRGDSVAMSDEYGKFIFQGLANGDYTVVIEKEKDFQPFSQVVSIRQIRGAPPQNYPLNIRLVIKGDTATTKPGVINAGTASVPRLALEFYRKALELDKTGDKLGAIEQLK